MVSVPKKGNLTTTCHFLTYFSDKRYLQGVTGEVNHGEMLMVMGPSGCGKSTFLHTLAGRAEYGKTEGRVYINGKEGSIQGYKEFIGFVPRK